MLVVLLLTVFVDLITAVAVGIVLASLLFVKRMSDLQLANIKTITQDSDEPSLSKAEKDLLAEAGGRIVLYHLTGPFSFGAAKGMARRLAAANEYDVLVLDLTDVPFLDSSASLALEDAIRQAAGRQKQVFLVGARGEVEKTLARLGVTKLLPEGHRHLSRVDALRQAVSLVAASD